MRRERTEIERKIIGCLAREGVMITYQVSEKTGLPKSSTYKFLGELESKGLVSSKRLRKNVRKKKNTKGETEYSLTVLGLSRAFILTNFDEWNPIIERCSHLLPLVLEKWDIFMSAGVEKTAWRNLTLAAGLVSESKFPPFKWGPSRDWNTIDKFYYYFFQVQFGLDDPKDQVKWVKACARDSEVKKYLTGQLTLMVKQHEVWLKREKAMLQILRKR